MTVHDFLHSMLAAVLAGVLVPVSTPARAQRPQAWLTTQDRSQLLAPQKQTFTTVSGEETKSITVSDAQPLQTIDGFGFALTGGSAQLLKRMSPAARHALLVETFGRGAQDVGVSYLRVSIGASDMNDHVYTYDDMPAGQTDPSLTHFSLAEDEKDVIPVLKEVLAISPKLAILASPWTAPSWMKTNELPKGGKLLPADYAVYASYFVRYSRACGRRACRLPRSLCRTSR